MLTELRKIKTNGGNLYYYIATVDSCNRFNMLTPISSTIDRLVRMMELSDSQAYRLQLKMRAMRYSEPPPTLIEIDENARIDQESVDGDWVAAGPRDRDEDDLIYVTIWVSNDVAGSQAMPAPFSMPSLSPIPAVSDEDSMPASDFE